MKDYELEYLDLSTGERLAYRRAGKSGPCLVLIHGNLCTSIQYQPLMEMLEDDFRVFAPDVAGFGESTYRRPHESLYEFSRDLVDFIEKMDLRDIFLVGWSTGGGIALEVAAALGDRVKKVFLQSAVGVKGYDIYALGPDYKLDYSKKLWSREEIEADRGQVRPAFEALRDQDQGYIRRVWTHAIYKERQPSKEDFDKYINGIMKQRNILDVFYSLVHFDFLGKIKEVSAPIIILHGTADNVVSIKDAQITKEAFGDQALLVPFEGLGHSLLTDDIDRLYREISSRIDT